MPHRSWGAHCSGTIKTVVLSNGVKLPVRQEIAELIALLCEATMKRGYRLVPGWCWGYACRKIRGSSSWSNHAWGLAVDLNAPKNPMTSRLVTDMPSWMPTLWKSYGFRWGGDYSGRKDAMHYEFLGSVTDAKMQTERARRELTGRSAPVPQAPVSGPPSVLSTGQIKWLAQEQGINGEALVIATAVALAESDGVVRAHNTRGADDSYGIWQINMTGDLGPDRRRAYGLKTNEDLFDPQTNARVMAGESKRGTNWKPWGAYTDKRYLKRMAEARAATPQPLAGTAARRKEVDMFIASVDGHAVLFEGGGIAIHIDDGDDLEALKAAGIPEVTPKKKNLAPDFVGSHLIIWNAQEAEKFWATQPEASDA
jgi:hypothetical protein